LTQRGALASGNVAEAAQWFTNAVEIRRALHEQELYRVDLAEELGVALYLLTGAKEVGGQDSKDLRQEVIVVLTPFEQAGALTTKGIDLLRWARE
jgi:hypothetical protein